MLVAGLSFKALIKNALKNFRQQEHNGLYTDAVKVVFLNDRYLNLNCYETFTWMLLRQIEAEVQHCLFHLQFNLIYSRFITRAIFLLIKSILLKRAWAFSFLPDISI